jgi:hypothetical protein
MLKSPLAGSYSAAAEHYRESDPPVDAPGELETLAPRIKSEPERGRG